MKKVILLSLSILLISLAYSFAEVPCKINYQGRLIKDNVPVDGTKTMKFSIYDSAVGPTLLWTSGDVSVEVHNGLFRYVIGSDGGDLSSINWTAGQALYLEVVIDGETLTPREELSAYPYAINSHLLEGEAKEYFINTSGETQTKQGNLNIIGNVGIGTTSPTSKLDVSGAIKYSGSFTGTILYGTTNSTGTPTKDGFRVRQDGGFFGGTREALVIEKTDGNASSPDGGIAFVNTGQDGIEDTAMVIRGDGDVGIGTTSPGEKLTVAGTIESTTGGVKFPDETVQTTAAAGFGSWTNKDSANNTLVKNAVYKATTDGFVSAVGLTAASGPMYIYTDSNNSPSTIRCKQTGYHTVDSYKSTSCFTPVRKNDYWRVTHNATATIYWLPMGSGQCVRQ